MNVLYWIIMICLVLAFSDSMANSVSSKNTEYQRRNDLFKAIVYLALMLLLKKVW